MKYNIKEIAMGAFFLWVCNLPFIIMLDLPVGRATILLILFMVISMVISEAIKYASRAR